MIAEVWGKVDGYDVIFKKDYQDGQLEGWSCTVPTDWQDGQYACSFVAKDVSGFYGYWTGMLYLTDGNSLCPRLQEDLFTVWVLPDTRAELLPERIEAKHVRRLHND